MVQIQAKSGGKRRRWLIVALMLVLSPVAWWYWPRGDARFVGAWEVSGSGVSTALKSIRWDLHSNGIGVTTFTTLADVSASYRFLWRAEDHQVIFGREAPTGFARKLLDSLQHKLVRTFGSSFIYTHAHFTAVSVSRDQIELRDADDPTKQTILKRLSE